MRADGQLRARQAHIDDAALVAGVNDRVQLAAMGAELNRRIVCRPPTGRGHRGGSPSTWIDVEVGDRPRHRDRPGNAVAGRHRIGGRCTIGPDTTLADACGWATARVVRTHGGEAVVGDGADVGPFTFLRPGTHLGAQGKLGAFVETKNATIGTGTRCRT